MPSFRSICLHLLYTPKFALAQGHIAGRGGGASGARLDKPGFGNRAGLYRRWCYARRRNLAAQKKKERQTPEPSSACLSMSRQGPEEGARLVLLSARLPGGGRR